MCVCVYMYVYRGCVCGSLYGSDSVCTRVSVRCVYVGLMYVFVCMFLCMYVYVCVYVCLRGVCIYVRVYAKNDDVWLDMEV